MSTKEKKLEFNKQTLQMFVQASLKDRKNALLSLLNPMGSIVTNVGVPFYASKVLASLINKTGDYQSNMYWLILMAILGIICNRIGFTKLMVLQARSMDYLHKLVFSRLLDRGIGFHTNRIGGKLVSDAYDFINSYGILIMAFYNNGVSLAAMLVSGLIIVFLNSWQLGVFLTITVGITIFWAYIESLRRSDLRTVRLVASKNLTGHLADSIVNAQTVKTFAGEDFEKKENRRLNNILRELRVNDWQRAGISGNNRIAFLLLVLILLLALTRQVSQTNPSVLSIGIFAFTYTFTLLMRLFDINTLTRQIEEAFLQASPIMQILSEQDEIQDSKNATDLKITNGNIELNNIEFNYLDNNGDQIVFDDLNLSIKGGEKVGIIGPSGGGKTTLTRLILRFEDLQGGSIKIDDQDIKHVTQKSLRQNLAYVPQEPLLFHRSIKENIGYGKPSASLEDIRKASKLAFADDFIQELPNGYDTIVGERGVKLSGGQRQRVAIARAILKNSPILIFDEATSALDSASEKVIQNALNELMDNKTAIVIAHRLSTIQKMDRIIVLENGKIIEQGSHKSLLEQNGLYAKLWKHQSGGFLED